jgi:RNA polymerase sigma-70 factor, ECF subfamily
VSGGPTSEPDLIRRARDGDEAAFAELVMLHGDRVYAALRRFGLGPDDAGDVAQEVFLRAWRGLDRFQARAAFSTWLYRIAFNEAQRRLARRTLPRAEPVAEGEDPVAALPDAPEAGPDARALADEFERQLGEALQELPPDWRAAVVLRDIEGLSTHDAAEVAGIGEPAFKSRLHRGRMQLRTLLEPYLQLEDG